MDECSTENNLSLLYCVYVSCNLIVPFIPWTADCSGLTECATCAAHGVCGRCNNGFEGTTCQRKSLYYTLDIHRLLFSNPKNSPKTPYSSPVRARYGVHFMGSTPDQSFGVVKCVISCYIRPPYIDYCRYLVPISLLTWCTKCSTFNNLCLFVLKGIISE